MAGHDHSPSRWTSRTPVPPSHRSIRSVSSADAHGVGPGPGRTVSAVATSACTNGLGSVRPGVVLAPARRPWRTTASSHPPSAVGAAATSSATLVNAARRWPRAAARRNATSRSRYTAASS